ncbi:MAG TPA: DUF202 domain-containing protein [Candidatus Binatia bacterium]|nr:DUF202 domain-containing protein [Candidatus Binatia bacterium]
MSGTALKPDNTELAVDRTWLAHERTLMAWVRTAVSMISFGFTIYKFFQFEAGRTLPAARGVLTPREFALIMISIGLVALLMATTSHRKETRGLAQHLEGRRSMAEIVAALVGLFGIAALLSALFRS